MKRHALVAILPLVFTSMLAHAVPEAAQEAREACKTKRLGDPCDAAYLWDSGAPPGTIAAPGQGGWVKTTGPAQCRAGTTLPDGGTPLICRVTSPVPTTSAPAHASSVPDASIPRTGTSPSASPSSVEAPAGSSAAKPAEASRGCSASSSSADASSGAVLVALGLGALAFASRRRRELGADRTPLRLP